MKSLLVKITFILLWPLIFLYAPLKVRARIMVISNGKYLGVLHNFGSNKWALPGGGVKKGEAYKDAAVRELYEELGIKIDPADIQQLVGLKTYNEGGHFMRYAIFVVKIPTQLATVQNHEISRVQWLLPHTKGVAKHVPYAVTQALSQGNLLK